MRRHRRAVRAAQNEIRNYMTALDARRREFVHAVAEKDAARAELQDVRTERDEVICHAETREVARIWTMF